MGIRITDAAMTSDATRHYAVYVPERGCWSVSWLPEEGLSRNEATTAMVLAETVTRMIGDGRRMVDQTHRMWPHLHTWAAELGLTETDAFLRCSIPPAVEFDPDHSGDRATGSAGGGGLGEGWDA